MSQPSRPGQPRIPVERSGTLIESDEEVRQAISGLKGQVQAQARPESPPADTVRAAASTPDKAPRRISSGPRSDPRSPC